MSDSVNILHVFGRMDYGGSEKRVLDLLRYVDRGRYQFHFCTLSGLPGGLDGEIQSLGGLIHPCPLGPSFLLRFHRFLRREKFDVVHSHVHYFSGIILRAAKKEYVPVRIAHFRSTHDGQPDGFRRQLQRKIAKRMIDLFATHILAVCEGVMEACWNPDWRKDPRCSIIYSGLDTAPFEDLVDRRGVFREFSVPPDGSLYIHVGNCSTAKNHERLLEIFSEIAKLDPRGRFLLVGRGTEYFERSLGERVVGLGLRGKIHCAGQRADIPRLLKAADLLLFPSKWEGLPGVVLEACASGIPVLATDLPGVREIAAWAPSVRYLSLSTSNTEWAGTAVEILSARKRNSREDDPVRLLNESKFGIRECVRRHCSVWDGNRPDPLVDQNVPIGESWLSD